MHSFKNVSLANFTSLGVGGNAENLVEVESSEDLVKIIHKKEYQKPLWVLGYGTNSLISDKGLPGTTVVMRNGNIKIDSQTDPPTLIADAGVWWDDVVQMAVDNDYWGLELMSGIPGSVGAAVAGNIAAYGQATSDSLLWVDVIDSEDSGKIMRMEAGDLGLSYRHSKFHEENWSSFVILRAAFALNPKMTQKLEYDSALAVAKEIKADTESLKGRRKIIMEARARAGSLYSGEGDIKTGGSFFKNPTVSAAQAEEIISFEERGVSSKHIKSQNKIHGGSEQRVSAAHVMLAAGFDRGQSWGNVRLHPDHVLKIENSDEATAQEIYDVVEEILATVKDKLNVDLKPEVRIMGDFS